MRVRKTDTNQKQIMDLCRKVPGLSVATIHTVGRGLPDLIMGYKGMNFLIEIKDGKKSASRKKLTPDEEKFHKNWKGRIDIVEKFDDILLLLKTFL